MQSRLLTIYIISSIACHSVEAFLSSSSIRTKDCAIPKDLQVYPFIQQRYAARNIPLEHVASTSAIIIPTAVGLAIENIVRRVHVLKKLQGIGALLTIFSASVLSTLGVTSPTNSICELCWTRLLPASLSLWLIASTVEEENREAPSRERTRDEMIAVLIPFSIGCIGSFIGCLLSFSYCFIGRNNVTRTHRHVLRGRKHFFFRPGHLLLDPAEAAVATGCLCSAYIGGPWNYFTTLRILASDQSLPSFAQEAAQGVLGGTFGSSASDILLMPLYFSGLQSIVASRRVSKIFPGRYSTISNYDSTNLKSDQSSNNNIPRKNIEKKRIIITALIIPTVWTIVRISDLCESRVGITGIGVAMNTILSCILPASFRFLRPLEKQSFITEIRNMTAGMSDVCFYMLLAVIGVSTNLGQEIFNGGWAPSSSFIFASTSLIVHFITIIFGSMGIMRLFPQCKQFPLYTEEIAVASCAAITGPQAAASLALKMSADERSSLVSVNLNWRGLILCATVLGVIGYVISCPIGVGLSKFLLNFIAKWEFN